MSPRRLVDTSGRVRRLVLVLFASFCVIESPAAAQSFLASSSGGYANVAVDAAGNLLVAYKVDTYEPTHAVELCAVPPRRRQREAQLRRSNRLAERDQITEHRGQTP
jgi:hypothetical protein